MVVLVVRELFACVEGGSRAGAAMVTRGRWRLEGDVLVRELAMRDFDEALDVVNRIATGAKDFFRRPDLCISEFNRVRITVANPHHAGITEAEWRLARKVDAVVDGA